MSRKDYLRTSFLLIIYLFDPQTAKKKEAFIFRKLGASYLIVCGAKNKNMAKNNFSMEVAGRTLLVETGQLAQQANGSALVRYGDTMVLATATLSSHKAEHLDYFPLMVDYEEKYYASGKIKGSRFIKREGRPTEEAILTARLIDRTIRPLFDDRIRNEVQVVITVLSIDQENVPDFLSIIAASLALGISDIPWAGPVSAVRVGKIENNFIINPFNSQTEKSDLEIVVSGTKDKINMIEAGAKELPEKEMIKAILFGFEELKKINVFQQKVIEKIGKIKKELEKINPTPEFIQEITTFLNENGLDKAFYEKEKVTRHEKMEEVKLKLVTYLEEKFSDADLKKRKTEVDWIYENYLNDILHQRILEKDERPDGRKLDEIRPISCQIGLLPRTHGSGLFNRGETQVITATTLGAPGMEQIVETMELDEKKRYMHHYNFPPFSVGEVKPMRGPGRRDIGHGALAERALLPVIPSKEEFPYTIRLVSEVLSSNGSSSMASTCGSSLSLMDAGVPIKKPVSGIAMGIITGKNGEFKVLSDIQGPEDHWGDMDFKIAGTKDGITALQLDVKIDGLTPEMIEQVFTQSYKSRMEIMDVMNQTIEKSRLELSPFAPRIITFSINPDKIRDVIGPGGKIINEIIDKTGVNIDIEKDGTIFITAGDKDSGEKAKKWIENLTETPEIGKIYSGKVTRIMNFGAFVEILPGKEGLVHISEIPTDRPITKINDFLKVNQQISVRLKEIDSMGRLNLTMKISTKK